MSQTDLRTLCELVQTEMHVYVLEFCKTMGIEIVYEIQQSRIFLLPVFLQIDPENIKLSD